MRCTPGAFDAGKEHFVIVHPTSGVGEDFKLLGLVFDHKLRMDSGVEAILKRARPKSQMLLRSRPYYSDTDMMLQFKTHILGILESNIGGIYHATQTVLAPLDRVVTTFVSCIGYRSRHSIFAIQFSSSGTSSRHCFVRLPT